MQVRQIPLAFPCQGETLVGVLSQPAEVKTTGIVVVVGGPQYRVGSHRQFMLLARALAARGYPCLRFDVRGMGDSTGDPRSFEEISDDIRAAVDTLLNIQAGLKHVVLWGLCDGASACCLYAPRDSRISGMVLLNPWVRTAAGEARTYLRHYYLRRLLSASFWKKLLTGGVSLGGSLGELAKTAAASSQKGDVDTDLPSRMAIGLERWGGCAQIVLSGRDYTAQEFEQALTNHVGWKSLVAQVDRLDLVRFGESDHTFSSARWRGEVERSTLEWLDAMETGWRT